MEFNQEILTLQISCYGMRGNRLFKSFIRFFINLFAAGLIFSLPVQATQWCPQKVICPLCGTANSFNVILAYGSYVYNWPSKFQYVFWPLTETEAIYSCKKCRVACFLYDFNETLKKRSRDIRKKLSTVLLDKEDEDYLKIPITKKLERAEMVYSVMDKDFEFWCEFYRVMGYHYDRNGDQKKARAVRTKALKYARAMLKDKKYKGQEKEILVISSAMCHFLGDDRKALSDLKRAEALTYTSKNAGEDNEKGMNSYLSELIPQYRELFKHSSLLNYYKKAIPGAHSKSSKAALISRLHEECLSLSRQKKYEEALEFSLLKIEISPDKANLYNNVGIIYRELEEPELARKYHEMAIQKDPSYGHAYYSLGLVYYDLSDYRKAEEMFLKAIQNKFKNIAVNYSLGQTYKWLKKYPEAIKTFEEVLDSEPRKRFVHYQLGDIYRVLKQYDRARAEFEKEIALYPSNDKLCRKALLEMRTELNPRDAEAFFNLGLIYKEESGKENIEKAIHCFQRVLILRSRYPGVHFQLGCIYEAMLEPESFAKAEREFSKEIMLNPNNEDARLALERIKKRLAESKR
jgi:tetratricopeptide (TPR) repeat protein